MEISDIVSTLNALELQKEEMADTIAEIKKRINSAPPGTLRTAKRINKFQYYQRLEAGDLKGTYIPRKDNEIAVKLAQKDYDQRLLAELEKQQKAIERFLKDFDPQAPLKVYEELNEPRKALVAPEFLSDAEFVKLWLEKPYKKLDFRKDDPEYYTARNERVRSKSEILIADALARHNIPYRYEYPIVIDGVPVAAPDFNCLNVRLRKDYYWEHLGMLDDAVYADNNVRKLNNFSLNPDFDESRLILTTETKRHPLNTKVVEEKIRRYLL